MSKDELTAAKQQVDQLTPIDHERDETRIIAPDASADSLSDTADDDSDELVDGSEAMAQLTELLVGQERESLAELVEKLESSRVGADEISEMLPLAVRKAANRDGKLAAALGPTLASSFQDSVKQNPKELADAISPIMGPAIRRSISQAIATMVQSLNQTLDHSFSWNGLKWRWQAFTTNKPFAEVVLLNAFVYRVEQVFLIHNEDGSLLTYVSADGAAGADADMVSGMLTAIQDFVRQSFGATDDDSIESLRVGDHHIWIVPSPHASLAAVIRGVPPQEYREQMKESVETIHAELSDDLANYEGDTLPFESSVPQLELCLQSKARTEAAKKPSPMKKLLPIVVLLMPLLLGGWLAYWAATSWAESRRHAAVVNGLQAPSTATLTYKDGVAKIAGQVRHAWIEQAKTRAGVLGIASLDLSEAVDVDGPWLRYLLALRAEPGLLVTESQINGDRYWISGLRDRDADDPAKIAAEVGLDLASVDARWEPYQALEKPFILKRLRRHAPQHPTVKWANNADGSQLTATGEASRAWLNTASDYAKSLKGDILVDVSQVLDLDRRSLEEAVAALKDSEILFLANSSQIRDAQLASIKTMAKQIARLQDMARQLREPLDILCVGYIGLEEDDLSSIVLAKERASQVWQALIKAGASKRGLFVRSGGVYSAPVGSNNEKLLDPRRCSVIVEQR